MISSHWGSGKHDFPWSIGCRFSFGHALLFLGMERWLWHKYVQKANELYSSSWVPCTRSLCLWAALRLIFLCLFLRLISLLSSPLLPVFSLWLETSGESWSTCGTKARLSISRVTSAMDLPMVEFMWLQSGSFLTPFKCTYSLNVHPPRALILSWSIWIVAPRSPVMVQIIFRSENLFPWGVFGCVLFK